MLALVVLVAVAVVAFVAWLITIAFPAVAFWQAFAGVLALKFLVSFIARAFRAPR